MALVQRVDRAETGLRRFRQWLRLTTTSVARKPDDSPFAWRPLAARLIAPLALLALVATAACGALAYVLVQHSDDRLQHEHRAALLSAVEEFRTIFADFTLHRATEIATLTWLKGPLTPAEAATRIAPAGRSRYRPERSYLLDADGRLIASFPPGENAVPPAVMRLIESFRSDEDTRRSAAATAPELLGRDIAPVVSDFVTLDDHPALAAIALLRAAPEGSRQPAPTILAAVARFDLRLVGIFERTADVETLRFDGEGAADGRETQSLIDRQGRIVGWMSWEARRPMAEAAVKLSPLLALIAVCFFGFAGVSLHQVGRATRQIAESEAQARKIAYEDVLTGLANRRRILELLDVALAGRAPNEIVTFAYLDLDGFKDINDSLGHHSGDALLVAVAAHLQAAFPAPSMCGRFGGDEFAAVIISTDADAPLKAANAAVQAMAGGFWVNNQAMRVGVSIGLAQAPRDGTTHDALLRHADLALRAAKRRGRACVVGFEPGMEQEFHDRQFITHELRQVLNEGGLAVHYQPIVAADGQNIVGVEALLRWTHPTRGEIPPGEFVPVAEQTGMMMELGEFVLRRAFADAMFWPGVYVAVNLSPVQVRDRKLIGIVAAALKDTGLSATRVILEITEGVLIDDPEDAKERLEQLRALGVKIALDDFGTGYSSLNYLQRFPIDKLKIDKSFVQPLGRSPNGEIIIQAITALGRALGLTVVCEGVETEEQRILLRLAGCNEMQGYLFARPGPRALIDRWLSSRGTASASGRT